MGFKEFQIRCGIPEHLFWNAISGPKAATSVGFAGSLHHVVPALHLSYFQFHWNDQTGRAEIIKAADKSDGYFLY